MNITPNIKMEQKQILNQAQIQSLEILSMDTLELENFLRDEYLNNPLLEYTPNNEMHFSMDDYGMPYENSYTGGNYKNDREDEREESWGLAAPKKDYLKDYLTSQLDIRYFSKKEWKLIEFLIECLEDDGLFKMEISEVCHLTGSEKEEVEDILDVLQDLEPYGIFAKNLSECLIKQLERMGIENFTLNEMIRNYLPEISEGKISVISRNLGLSTAEVRKYIAIISKLNPKPLSGMQDDEVNYIVPDIIFEKKENQWEVRINDNWFGNYTINDYYLKMMKETKDAELFAYFSKKLEKTRFIISSIEQRRTTMQSICAIILEKQKGYFDKKELLKPMLMAEIAEELNMHPSTVTRALKGKYLQYPEETILMKKLFCTSVAVSKEGESLSASHIKERIRELVRKEDKKKPYSDAKLTEILKNEGIHISRRVVAKYRDELWIKSSYERKMAGVDAKDK